MIADLNDIPESWRAALACIQEVLPSAVMAGGCLRDRDNGRAVKDIDIFAHGYGESDLWDAHAALKAHGLALEDIDMEKMYPVDGAELIGVIDVRQGPWPLALPVQIIMTTWDTDKIVQRFDYGICRIAFDGQKITRSDDYLLDKHNKVFRLVRERTAEQLEASVMRYARLSPKYEGWPFKAYISEIDFIV